MGQHGEYGLWGRRSGALMGIAVFAGILLFTAGCGKDSPASSPCEGFGGGNIVGKWRYRFLVPDALIEEYRADGTYRTDGAGGKDVHEGTYEVDGNELKTFERVGNGTARGTKCFDVQGSVLRKRDKNTTNSNLFYFDRI